MSTQKGNTSRTRPQKHQNKTKYKNDLHDKSHKMKLVNSLEIDNVCTRCKDIIEWKIRYKKYKPLKTPGICVKCYNKSIKHAYHTICGECSKKLNICPKCQLAKELVTSPPPAVNVEDFLKLSEVKRAIKSMSERRRRTFYRYLSKPSCNLTTEEEILNKIREMSIGSGEGDLDDFGDDIDVGSSEQEVADDDDDDIDEEEEK